MDADERATFAIHITLDGGKRGFCLLRNFRDNNCTIHTRRNGFAFNRCGFCFLIIFFLEWQASCACWNIFSRERNKEIGSEGKANNFSLKKKIRK